MGETGDLKKEMLEIGVSIAADKTLGGIRSWFHRSCREQRQRLRNEQAELAFAFLAFAEVFDIRYQTDGRLSFESSTGKRILDDPKLSTVLMNAFDAVQRICPEVYARWKERMQVVKMRNETQDRRGEFDPPSKSQGG